MCKYKEICPAYDERSDDCNKNYQLGSARCVPFLLEAYHSEKGTPFCEIINLLHIPDDIKGFKMLTVLDVFKTCEKEYQRLIYEEFKKIYEGDQNVC